MRSLDPAGALARTLRILVVDDCVDIGETTAELLNGFGHEAVWVDGPHAALRRLEDESFDVGLIDIGLPGMDGYALAREVRGRGAGATLRLVAVTGWGRPEDEARALEAGFDLHLAKPVDPERLRRVLAGMSADGI